MNHSVWALANSINLFTLEIQKQIEPLATLHQPPKNAKTDSRFQVWNANLHKMCNRKSKLFAADCLVVGPNYEEVICMLNIDADVRTFFSFVHFCCTVPHEIWMKLAFCPAHRTKTVFVSLVNELNGHDFANVANHHQQWIHNAPIEFVLINGNWLKNHQFINEFTCLPFTPFIIQWKSWIVQNVR